MAVIGFILVVVPDLYLEEIKLLISRYKRWRAAQ